MNKLRSSSQIADNGKSKDVTKVSRKYVIVTEQQKKLIIKFVMKNPEIITHETSKENENELWIKIMESLNKTKPEKSLGQWKSFLTRWSTNLKSKQDANLIKSEQKFKKFLNKLNNNGLAVEKSGTNEKLCEKFKTIDEIDLRIKELEKEKYQLNLKLDSNEIRIITHNNTVRALEKDNDKKRQQLEQINIEKKYLNQKRNKLNKKRSANQIRDNQSLGYIKIKKEVVFDD